MAQASPAVCEIDGCSVLAVGRCATCKRAFCLTHQARGPNITFSQAVPYVDMCAPCLAERQAKEAEQRRVAEAPRDYIRSGEARSDLLTAGVQTVEIYEVRKDLRQIKKTGLFGRTSWEDVEVATLFKHGWIIGEFKWYYYVPNRYKEIGYEEVSGECLTALLDLSPGISMPSYSYEEYAPLYPIEPYSGGYQVLGRTYRVIGDTPRAHLFVGGWENAMQAVKRLVGKTS